MINRLALAAAAMIAAAGSAEAQTILPNANNCVSVSSISDGSSSGNDWSPRYRARNNCPEEITFTYRHNYGLSYEGTVSCSGGAAFDLQPGGSDTISAGPLPKGVKSYIRWCAQYDDSEHQDLTGYMDCYESNQPSCPPLQ